MQLQAWWWLRNYLNWRKSTADRSFSEVRSLHVAVGSLTHRVTFEFIVSKVCGPIASTSNSTHNFGCGMGLGDVWWAALYTLWFKFLSEFQIQNYKWWKRVRFSFSLSHHRDPKYMIVFFFVLYVLKRIETLYFIVQKHTRMGPGSKVGRGETF